MRTGQGGVGEPDYALFRNKQHARACSPGPARKIPEAHAVAIEELLGKQCFVAKCVVYPRIGAVAVCYRATAALSLDEARQALLREVGQLQRTQIERWKPEDSLALAPRPRHLFSALANMTLWYFCRSIFCRNR